MLQEWRFGFKRITADNAFLPDEMYTNVGISGKALEAKGREMLERILEPQAQDCVPEHLRALFEVARGTCVYGIAFYPLNHVGMHQLYLCVEAAFSEKCRALQPEKRKWKLGESIPKLRKAGLLEGPEGYWHSYRNLRNHASHPERISILPQGAALRLLRDTAHILNHLWGPSGTVPRPPRPPMFGVPESFLSELDEKEG